MAKEREIGMKTHTALATMGHAFYQGVNGWLKETKGSVMVLMALSLPVVVGVTGLGVDLSSWYAERRLTQNIADSAVVAATHAVMAGMDQQGVEAEALSEAQRNGYESRAGDEFVVTLLNGEAMGASTAEVQVLVRRTAPVFFTSMFIDYKPSVAASAMGGIRGNGTNCIIGLDPYAPHTVNFMGNTTVNVGCGVYSHSEAAESLYVGGNATLYANPAQARGDIIVSGSGEIYSANGNLMPFNAINNPDPYADTSFPAAPGSCDYSGQFRVKPNRYDSLAPSSPGGSYKLCGDFNIQGDLDMAPGTYYIHNGDISINSQAEIHCPSCTSGSGLTIVMTGSSAGSVGDIHINGGAVIDIKAPSTGAFAGIVLYKDRTADSGGSNLLNGGSTMELRGAIYIPTQAVDFRGGADLPGCIHLIARMIDFSGNSYLRNDEAVCTDVGISVESSTQQRQVVLLN